MLNDDLKQDPILYVDDDRANRIVMKHNLGAEFSLIVADSADAALRILAEQHVAVLLADHRMPGMTGVDLAEQALKLYPDVIRVIITAYSDLEATVDAINRAHVNRFIKKPWTPEELVAVMRDSILGHRNTRLVKELQERIAKLDRVATIAIMSSSIAHDLRQPLAYIEPNVHVLRSELEELLWSAPVGSDLHGSVEIMLTALTDLSGGVEKLKVICNALLSSLRSESQPHVKLDLRRIVESALTLTRSAITSRALLEAKLPLEKVEMRGSEGRLLQLVVNLLLNAAQAIKPGAAMQNRIRVSLGVGETVSLTVEDTGCGIPADALPHIFTPLFTTKGAAGTGLGLAICRQVVEEMQGSITVDSSPGRGSRFVVVLPR